MHLSSLAGAITGVCTGLAIALAIDVAIKRPAAINPAASEVRIQKDGGGSMLEYISKYVGIKETGARVVVDGDCVSACTLLTGLLPRTQVCVTPNARFGFHSASVPDPVIPLISRHSIIGTAFARSLYPTWVHEWVKQLGWDIDDLGTPHPEVVYVPFETLRTVYAVCGAARS